MTIAPSPSPTTSAQAAEHPSAGLQAGRPRIALVTPVLNAVKYIEATIRSVLMQDYPNLEYVIVDGGSTDGTLEVIRKYEDQISGWLSQPDGGMYDALNKGFARSAGDVMGWISATDQLHVGGLKVVGSVFRDLPGVEWVTGRPTTFDEDGATVGVFNLMRWSRYRFLAGANKYIQQESTFWRRSLWEKAGGYLDTSGRYGLASDFELWVRFFRHARLYSVDALIGGFRHHAAALGLQHLAEYQRIQQAIVDAELQRGDAPRLLRWLRNLNRAVNGIPKVRNWWNGLVLSSVYELFYTLNGSDLPPVIEHCEGKWSFRSIDRSKPDPSAAARRAK